MEDLIEDFDFSQSFHFDDFQVILIDRSGWGGLVYLILEDAHGGYKTARVDKKLVYLTTRGAEEPARALRKRFFSSWETAAEVINADLHHFLTDCGHSEQEASRFLDRAYKRMDNPTRAAVERVAEDGNGDYEAVLDMLQGEYHTSAEKEKTTPEDLGVMGSSMDHVLGYEVTHNGYARTVTFHLADGRELNASQKIVDQGPSHGGDPDAGTFEILIVRADGEQAKNSPYTMPGQAVKGGLSTGDVLGTLRKMAQSVDTAT